MNRWPRRRNMRPAYAAFSQGRGHSSRPAGAIKMKIEKEKNCKFIVHVDERNEEETSSLRFYTLINWR